MLTKIYTQKSEMDVLKEFSETFPPQSVLIDKKITNVILFYYLCSLKFIEFRI